MFRFFRFCLCAAVFRHFALCCLLAALCDNGLQAKDRVAPNQRPAVSTNMKALAAQVSGIANDTSISRAKKANRISSVVREVLAAATARKNDSEEILAITLKVTSVAASAAPHFAEAIASAVALSPVGRESQAAGKIRTAAYEAAHNPESARNTYLVAEADPTPAEIVPAPVVVTTADPVSRSSEEKRTAAVADQTTSAADTRARVETVAVDVPATSQAETTETPSVDPAGENKNVVQLEKFVVKGDMVKGNVYTERKKASVSIEVMTASEWNKKFIVTDLADIVIRMPGLSTTSKGTFAVVRGLAERYNPIMMDGIVLPSSDPERQSPELDLFPSRLVDALVISKAYEPRLPATASGASINMLSKPIPESRFAQIQFGLKFDEGNFGNEAFLSSRGTGVWDYLALGVKDRVAQQPADAIGYVRSPRTVSNLSDKKFPLGSRFSFAYEDRVVLNEEKKRAFGYAFSFAYDRTASSESGKKTFLNGIFNSTDITNTGAARGNANTGTYSFNAENYVESELESRFGLLGTLGFAFNDQHQVALSYFWSQLGLDTHAQTTDGIAFSATPLADFESYRSGKLALEDVAGVQEQRTTDAMEIYYRQRSLTNLHASGEHLFNELKSFKLNWDLAKVAARQQEPEYLLFPYTYDPNSPNPYSASFGAGIDRYTRYWRDTQEKSKIGRLDAEYKFDLGPLYDTVLRVGFYADRTDRDYVEGTLYLQGGQIVGQTREELVRGLRTYTTNPSERIDSYSGSVIPPFASGERKINASYLSLDLPLAKERPGLHKLDLLMGVRLEDYQLTTEGFGLLGTLGSGGFYDDFRRVQQLPLYPNTANPKTVYRGNIDEKKYLPAVALAYSPIKPLTLRLAWSKTTARPSFREVGSYFTADRVADEYVHGNFGLQTSDVTNYDFRVEYFFPKSRDLVALSVFKKKISRPIERVSFNMNNVGPISSFINNSNDADLRGMEMEAAKNLGFLGGVGEWFSVGGNFTLLEAEVARDASFESSQIESPGIKDTRNLYDQPKWIANSYITFDHKSSGFSATASWFAISDVLQKVNNLSWDTYVASYSRFDLSLSQYLGRKWVVRLSGKNLNNPERKLVADPANTTEEIIFRRYRDGRSYSVSASYEF